MRLGEPGIVSTKFTLVALLLLAAAAPARADDDRLGLMFDAGFPDGGNASLVLRPFAGLRLAAGGGTNLISPGVRGGASWVFPAGFVVSVEGGHYFSGDATSVARVVSGNSNLDSPALRDVSYDYVDLHAGIEFGPPTAKFFIHGGSSYVSGAVKNAGASANQALGQGMTTITFAQDPRITGWVISARVGVILYLF
jgi:hypothetical protein